MVKRSLLVAFFLVTFFKVTFCTQESVEQVVQEVVNNECMVSESVKSECGIKEPFCVTVLQGSTVDTFDVQEKNPTKSFMQKIVDGVQHTVHRVYQTANGFVYLVGIGTIVYVVYVCYNREKINVDICEHLQLPEVLQSCSNANGYVSVVRLPGAFGGSFILPSWFSNMIDAGGDVLRATVVTANNQAQHCKDIANAALVVAGQGINHLKEGGKALGDLAATGLKVTSDQLASIAAVFTNNAEDQGAKFVSVVAAAGIEATV